MQTGGFVCGGWGLHRWRQDVCAVLPGMAVVGVRSKEKEKPLFKTPTSKNNHVTIFRQSRPQHFSGLTERLKPKQAEAAVNARSAAPLTAMMKRVESVWVWTLQSAETAASAGRGHDGVAALLKEQQAVGKEGRKESQRFEWETFVERQRGFSVGFEEMRTKTSDYKPWYERHNLLFYRGRRGVYTSLSARLHSSVFIVFISHWQQRPQIWFQGFFYLLVN